MDKRMQAALLATFATLSLAGCENMTRQEKGWGRRGRRGR